MGDRPQLAMAIALIDAALRSGGELADGLTHELEALDQQITQKNEKEQALVASTRVDFERM